MKISAILFTTLAIWEAQAFQLLPQITRSSQTRLFSQAKDETTTSTSTTNRRAFVLSSLTAAVVSFNLPASVQAAGSIDYKAVSADIADLIKQNPDSGPTLVRLAWHSSGTYDKMSKTGGTGGGTIRFKEELAHGGNAGLATTAVEWMEPLHKKYADAGLSYADLYALGGGEQ
jgi:catalase (peroxidase I)